MHMRSNIAIKYRLHNGTAVQRNIDPIELPPIDSELAPDLGSKTTSNAESSLTLNACSWNTAKRLVEHLELCRQLSRLRSQIDLVVHVESLADTLQD
jgi:hypothetical protein